MIFNTEEIHRTEAEDGTVTIMQNFPTQDGESAREFWPINETRGSAEPRKATRDEVACIVENALNKYF